MLDAHELDGCTFRRAEQLADCEPSLPSRAPALDSIESLGVTGLVAEAEQLNDRRARLAEFERHLSGCDPDPATADEHQTLIAAVARSQAAAEVIAGIQWRKRQARDLREAREAEHWPNL